MARIKVFYDFHDDDGFKPQTMVIRFRRGEMQWDKPVYYVRLEAPFQQQRTEDYHPETFGLAVYLEDLMLSPHRPNEFGVNVQRIRERYKLSDDIPDDEVNMIIRMCDIEDVMHMDVRHTLNGGIVYESRELLPSFD
jgi:hypothetical protein